MKKIRKKIGIILLAALISPLLALTQTGDRVASADEICSITNFADTTAVESKAKTMGPAELDDCISTAKQLAKICTSSSADDKTKCDAITSSANALTNQKSANDVTVTIKNYAETDLKVTDMFTEDSQCLTDDDTKYSVVIEEVIESELTANHDIVNCMRNTLCVERDDKLGIECVTTLRKVEGNSGCSGEAQAKVKKPDPAKKVSLYCQPVQVLRSDSGTDLLFLYIGTIYRWAASVIGIIAVLVIVISGIQISAAAGEQQAITNAKTRIFQSIGGLVLLFLSGIVLYTINPTFFTG